MARIVSGPEITGVVVNQQTGAPIGGATVTVNKTVYTDPDFASGTTTLTADGYGVFFCYAGNGTYTFTTTVAGAASIEPVTVRGTGGSTGSGAYVPFTLPGGWSATGVGTRRAQANVQFSSTSGASFGETDGCARYPTRLPVATSQWRLRLRSINGGNNTPLSGAISFSGLWIGAAALTSTGTPVLAGTFTATPAQALGSFTTDAAGAEYVSAWVTDPTLQFSPDVIYLLSFGYSLATGQVVGMGSQNWCYAAGATAKSQAGNASVSGMGTYPQPYWDIRIEYEFSGGQPVGLVVGDSLSSPYGPSNLWVTQAWHDVLAARARTPMIGNGSVGATVASFSGVSAADWKWARVNVGDTIDFAAVELGSNDANNNRTLAQYQADVLSLVTFLRGTLGIKHVILSTVAPRGFTGAQLTAPAPAAATTISTTKSLSGTITIGEGAAQETATVSSVSGTSAPYTVTLSAGLTNAHYTGENAVSAQEALRRSYNAWLRTAPFACGLFDIDRIMSDPIDSTNIRAEWRDSDNVHWKAAGHGALAAALPSPAVVG